MVIATVHQLLTPIGWDAFVRDIWSKTFLHVPGPSNKSGGLFSWHDLNSALEAHRFRVPRLRLELNRVRIDESLYTVERPSRLGPPIERLDVARVYYYLREGATLVLDAIDELAPNVSRLCESLTETFNIHVQVNAYATWGQSPGFGLHWDDHDVFVVQISGRKNWNIYPVTRLAPLYRDFEPNDCRPTEAIWSGVVKEGDVLYIPRGQWHEATGLGEPTLHLTFGVNCPTGTMLLSWLVDELRAEELLRRDLPIFASAEQREAHGRAIKEALLEFVGPNIIDRYMAYTRSAMTARPRFSFPHGVYASEKLLPATRLRYTGMAKVDLQKDHRVVFLKALGREWEFHTSTERLINVLFTKSGATVAELIEVSMPELSEQQVQAFIGRLIHEGFLAVDRG